MKTFTHTIISIFFFALPPLLIQGQVPLNWMVDEVNPGDDVTISPDETFFSEGTRSCHLQLHSGAVPYLFSDYYFITPGDEYQFSIDVFDNDTAGMVKVYADFYDQYGFDIFGADPQLSVDTNIWQTITWQGIVPEQAVVGYVLVKYYCQPNLYVFTKDAEAWIDNTRFLQAGSDNLVANGGFENWVVGIGDHTVRLDQISVSPNPAKDLLQIKLPVDGKTLVVNDINGRQMILLGLAGESKYHLDVSDLNEGIYLLTIITERGQYLFSKFIVSH